MAGHQTTDGSVLVSDVSTNATMEIRATVGSVQVSRTIVGSRLDVATTSGGIEVDTVEAESIIAATGGGSIALGSSVVVGGPAECRFEFETVNGNVEGGPVSAAAATPTGVPCVVTGETTRGAVELEIAAGSGTGGAGQSCRVLSGLVVVESSDGGGAEIGATGGVQLVGDTLNGGGNDTLAFYSTGGSLDVTMVACP